jgi:IPT/TIG domain/PASTA domain
MTDRQLRGGSKRSGTHSGRGRAGRTGLAAIAVAGAFALLTAGAQASTVTVGSVLPSPFVSTAFKEVRTQFNTVLPEKGANLVSPTDGAVVRWRVQGAKGGPFFLRVLHPSGTGAYSAAGTSGPATPTGTGLQTFTTNMPIRAGDLIGIDPSNGTDEIGVAEASGASFAFIFPPPFDGATVAPSGTESGHEIELSAEIQPTPAVTAIAPASGSIVGGTTVTIKGTDFNGTSEVKFGEKPAASLKVDNDNQITATSPSSKKPGKVHVTVTTLAGSSPNVGADRFNYTACIVPKLAGKHLKAAKKSLKQASCKLGTVKKVAGPTSKVGEVVKQSPKAGKVLAPGAKVGLKLGK